MSDEKKQAITRRSFLKSATTGAGAIAVTGAGLLAAENAVAQSASSAPASSSQTAKYSWETPPAAIPDSRIKEKVTKDIVIIGCGVSGATASASASEAGAKVIVIEKHTTYNSRGSDNAVIDSRMQKKLGIKVDKDEIILALQKYSGNRSDQRLLRLWADNSGKIMDWITDIIVAGGGSETTVRYWPEPDGFDYKKEYYQQFPVVHNFSGGQAGLVEALMANAKKKGAEFRFNTRAVQLIRKDKGRVTGVIAQDQDGNYIQFNATKAVMLCTGEYGHDYEMMAAYCPSGLAFAEASPYNPPVNTGDGHKMAMWIGGVLQPWPHPPLDHTSGGTMGNSAFLHVNNLGERYENEDTDSGANACSMRRQPGNCYWQIYDSKYQDEVAKLGFGFLKGSEESTLGGEGGGRGGAPGGAGGAPGGAAAGGAVGFTAGRAGGAPGGAAGGPGGAGGPGSAAGGAPGGAAGGPGGAAGAAPGGAGGPGGGSGGPPSGEKVQANNIADLARKMKVPADTLKATIARYNELCKIGKDLDFGKRPDRLTTVEKPPFYASQAIIGFLVALGGFYVNTKLQLLDEDRKPIQGIYLAGNTVGNRFGVDYPLIAPGLSHAFAWTTGYMAAKNAAAEKA
jgi:fumarate reductase flavoprotein subunit